MAGRLFFFADDGRGGGALWRSDGTARGTRLLSDFGGISYAEQLITAGDRLFLTVLSEDWELWWSDGTARGTTPMSPSLPGVSLIGASGGAVYLTAEGPDGHGLMRIDPPDGEPIRLGPLEASSLVDVGGTFFGLVEGRRLWRHEVGEIAPYTRIAKVAPVDDRLLLLEGQFGGYACCWAVSLWTSDGTEEGTVQLQYLPWIEDGRESWSEEPQFVRAGEQVFFNADSGDIGDELWALPFDALPEICRGDCLGTPAPTVTPVPSTGGGSDGCQVDARRSTAGWPLAITAALVLVALIRRSASRRVRQHAPAVHC